MLLTTFAWPVKYLRVLLVLVNPNGLYVCNRKMRVVPNDFAGCCRPFSSISWWAHAWISDCCFQSMDGVLKYHRYSVHEIRVSRYIDGVGDANTEIRAHLHRSKWLYTHTFISDEPNVIESCSIWHWNWLKMCHSQTRLVSNDTVSAMTLILYTIHWLNKWMSPAQAGLPTKSAT